jgi:flagellar hook-associated protein 3 FlgL
MRNEISRYTQELSTGQVTDVRQALRGNYYYLTEIERKVNTLNGYSVATAEAAHYSAALQTIFGRVSDTTQNLSNSLLNASTIAAGSAGANLVTDANQVLHEIFGHLNTEIAGRFLLSGAATDQIPLATTETLLASARSAMIGATTPAEMIAQANLWFEDPAGFEAVVYQGSDAGLSPFTLSDSQKITLDIRANDPDVKQLLKLITISALADESVFSLNSEQKTELMVEAGKQMLAARDNITKLAAQVGYAEARIDAISVENASELSSVRFAKSDLLSVDPFEAATRLEKVQFQLQSLYTVTARNAQLSLVNFL